MINRRLLEELALEWEDGEALIGLDDAELAYELLLRFIKFPEDSLDDKRDRNARLRVEAKKKRIPIDRLRIARKAYETAITRGDTKKKAQLYAERKSAVSAHTVRHYVSKGWPTEC